MDIITARNNIRENLKRMPREQFEDNIRWASKRELKKSEVEKIRDPSFLHIELIKAFIEIETKDLTIEELKEELKQRADSFKSLEDNEQKLSEIRIKFQEQEKQYANSIDLKNKELEELKRDSDQRIRILEIQKDMFRKHLIEYHLKNKSDLLNKPLEYLNDLFEQIKNMSSLLETKNVEDSNKQVSIRQDTFKIDPLSEDYIKSQNCVCGRTKWYGAKGCENCKQAVDRLRKRLDVGMGESWIEHWRNLGISVEKLMEESLEVEEEND